MGTSVGNNIQVRNMCLQNYCLEPLVKITTIKKIKMLRYVELCHYFRVDCTN